jgi:hypothetical protein
MTDRIPEFVLTVTVADAQQSLTGVQLAAELRRVADLLESETEDYAPDFSGEWHDTHPSGAVTSHAFWQGGPMNDSAPGTGCTPPAGAWERLGHEHYSVQRKDATRECLTQVK